jgi:hypothetical protein
VIVRDKLRVFVGPFVPDPLIVIGNVPAVAVAVVSTVSVIATGVVEVGFTEPEGRKLHDAPEGKFPQERFTVSSNAPCPVTSNETGPETFDGGAVMLADEGAVKLKSTTFKVKKASFWRWDESSPEP